MASPSLPEGDSLLISDLSIGVPAFKAVLPLPIPIPIPLRLHRLLFGDESSMQGAYFTRLFFIDIVLIRYAYAEKEIVSNVTARCRPGEILAM